MADIDVTFVIQFFFPLTKLNNRNKKKKERNLQYTYKWYLVLFKKWPVLDSYTTL